jgi:hypothetical protein
MTSFHTPRSLLTTIFKPSIARVSLAAYRTVSAALVLIFANLPLHAKADGLVCHDTSLIRGSLNTSSSPIDICISGSTVYLALQDSEMQIVDVSNPDEPILIGSYIAPGQFEGIAVQDELAYISILGSGLHIVDVTNPSSTVLIGSVDTPGSQGRIEVAGDTVYLVQGVAGLQIIDVSDPSSPILQGSFDTPGIATAITVEGNTAFVTDYDSSIQIIDVSNPDSPSFISSISPSNLNVREVSVVDERAYAIGRGSGIHTYDISNLAEPVLLGAHTSSNGSTYGDRIDVVGSRAHIMAGTFGFAVYDITNPSYPVRQFRYEYTAKGSDLPFAQVLKDGLAYVLYSSGLRIFDIDRYGLGTFSARRIGNVKISGSNAYATGIDNDLGVLDISNTAAPSLINSVRFSNGARDVFVVGSNAYLISSDMLGVIDISEPNFPSVLGLVDLPIASLDRALNIFVSNSIAYIGSHDSGLHIVDVSDPKFPIYIGAYSISEPVERIAVTGTTAYIGLQSGIELLDVSDPAVPISIGSMDTPDRVYDITVIESTAYLAVGDFGMHIYDVSDPSSLVLVGSLDTQGRSLELSVTDSTAYIADENAGLQIVDVSDPSLPTLLDSIPRGGPLQRITVIGAYAYMSTEYIGFEIVHVGSCGRCLADVDSNRVVNMFDAFAFVEAYLSNSLVADINLNGFLDVSDILTFIELYNLGCTFE